MDRTKLLVGGLVAAVVVAAATLAVALWPASADDLRRTKFYQDGLAIGRELPTGNLSFTTCEEGFKAAYKMGGPAWSQPKTGEDEDAFLLGCEEGSAG